MTPPEPLSSYQANLQRGAMLRHQKRFAESEKYLQEAISERANQAEGYYELAFCYCNWPGHSRQALTTVDRAIALEPNRADFLALRAWILGNLDKNKEAVRVADEALALNPFSILALNAQVRAYNDLQDWKQSEVHARRVLAVHPQNELAGNLLAISLRQQGRLAESEQITATLLSHVPDSAMAQCNAGWSALQAGDYRRANQHFLEALRLDPAYESARRGLLHAFNSRVWIYRLYFQFVAWLGKYRKEMRVLFFIVVYVGYRFVLLELRTRFGHEGMRWGFVVVALYLVIFGFGRSFGNLFLLLDRFARHALTRKEKLWSLLAGAIYGSLLGLLISDRALPQAAVLIGILAFFLWGVLQPRFQDALARKAAVKTAAE